MSKDEGPRWTALLAKGCDVVLTGRSGNWTVIHCVSNEDAQHRVSELNAWAKHAHDTEEVKALCQS